MGDGISEDGGLNATLRCVSEHPSGDPFDPGGEPRPDPSTGEMTLPTLDVIGAECELDSGADCTARFISEEAARCIAENESFGPRAPALGSDPLTTCSGPGHGSGRIVRARRRIC